MSDKETAPQQFRTKSVVKWAVQLTALNALDIIDDVFPAMRALRCGDGSMRIQTREGEMTAKVGDWIIQGLKGEFYPCKPEIFVESYEPVAVECTAPAPQPADKYPSLDSIHLAIMDIARLSHAGKHGQRVKELLEKLIAPPPLYRRDEDGIISVVNEAATPEVTPADEDSPEVKAEQTRWQDAIYERCKKAVGPENDDLIDGGGCDSGDPLDVTLAEIGQAIGFWQDKAEELAAIIYLTHVAILCILGIAVTGLVHFGWTARLHDLPRPEALRWSCDRNAYFSIAGFSENVPVRDRAFKIYRQSHFDNILKLFFGDWKFNSIDDRCFDIRRDGLLACGTRVKPIYASILFPQTVVRDNFFYVSRSLTGIKEINCNYHVASFIWKHDIHALRGEPSSLIGFECPPALLEVNDYSYQTSQPNDDSGDSDFIESLGRSKLAMSGIAFLGITLVFFGTWLMSYGERVWDIAHTVIWWTGYSTCVTGGLFVLFSLVTMAQIILHLV